MRGEDAVKQEHVHRGPGDDGRELLQEFDGLEEEVRGSIAPRRLGVRLPPRAPLEVRTAIERCEPEWDTVPHCRQYVRSARLSPAVLHRGAHAADRARDSHSAPPSCA